MADDRRGTLQFIGVANFIICAIFLIFALALSWGQIRVLRSWPAAQARVVRSQVVTEQTPDHRQLYSAQLEIAYRVDGRPVTAQLTHFISKNYERTARRAAEFPVGSYREVRYDPQNPAQPRIGAGWNARFFTAPLITLGFGIVFGIVAGGLFVVARFAAKQPACMEGTASS